MDDAREKLQQVEVIYNEVKDSVTREKSVVWKEVYQGYEEDIKVFCNTSSEDLIEQVLKLRT